MLKTIGNCFALVCGSHWCCAYDMFFLFFPLVCKLQQTSCKHQERKTEQESPLITSPSILVGIPG